MTPAIRNERAIRGLWWFAISMIVLAAAGLAGLDEWVAAWTATLPKGETVWRRGTDLLDLITGKELTNFLLGFLLLVAGLALNAIARFRRFGRPLLYVGLVQFSSTFFTDLSKRPFGRQRPWEADDTGRILDQWFVGANSFPSGHAGFYFGLFAPLIMLFPRWTAAFAIVPLFIGVARIVSHDHYLADVAISAAIAALLAIGWAWRLDRGTGYTPPASRSLSVAHE